MPVGLFPSTHWSVVLAAGGVANEASREALCRLCEVYRAPLLAFARTLVAKPEDAEDLAQGFLLHLLRKEAFSGVHRKEGSRFRSFLLQCFRHFVRDEWDRRRAQKRGGGVEHVSLSVMGESSGLVAEVVGGMDAVAVYEREWVMALLGQVLDRLEGEYAARGRRRVFEQLQSRLPGLRQDMEDRGGRRRTGCRGRR
jgi:RNA polymerase sigma-70 factor (ECF subfamily)